VSSPPHRRYEEPDNGGVLCEVVLSEREGLGFGDVQRRIRDLRQLLRDGTFPAGPLSDYQISDVPYLAERSPYATWGTYETSRHRRRDYEVAALRMPLTLDEVWPSGLKRATREVENTPVALLHYGSPIELILEIAPYAQGLAAFVWQLALAARARWLR
jgi:hypothetical protein